SLAINTLGYIESTILPLPDRDLHCSLRRPDPLDHTPHASDLPYTLRLDPTVTLHNSRFEDRVLLSLLRCPQSRHNKE
ncbi:hypothetical protein BGZ61DRAFT_403488, partial [Ilyonectria robusta]|uniref:uncharacterized protein n=1 Tax=Ilyonectria robusta TaxID=1079257 RepID=UPI001E8DB0B4